MACDPTDIGSAPVNFAVVIIEYILVGHRGVDHITTGCVENPFRLSCRARRIENKEGVFGIHFFRGTFG